MLIRFVICDSSNGFSEQEEAIPNNPPLSELDQKLLLENDSYITVARLDTIYGYDGVTSAIDRRAKRVSMLKNTEFFRMLIYDESDFRVRYKGSGIFSAVKDFVEYLALGNGDLNGGDMDVLRTSIKDITTPAHLLTRIAHDEEDNIALRWDHGCLGGCSMTCMTGESGSGKSSLIKLLCGFNPNHMNLCACALRSVEPNEYRVCFEVLGLDDLMDQPFGTLLGGQK
eukprot:scaffold3835_cov295-Chaetoceros_neogracile.AAC.4